MTPSPLILMSAINGARRRKKDHPALPMTTDEIAAEAQACFAAGAAALHMHVRDDDGRHSLDHGRYCEAIAAVKEVAPDMIIQLTSEAAGIYEPETQIDMIYKTASESISVAFRELQPDKRQDSLNCYHWLAESGIHTQHILYEPEEVTRFCAFADRLPEGQHHVLYVLGRYTPPYPGAPEELDQMLQTVKRDDISWMVCSFGSTEQKCLLYAAEKNGHARIGFENNLKMPDGSWAASNADLVNSFAKACPRPLATAAEVRTIWGI